MTKRIIFIAIAVIVVGILITALRLYSLQKDVSRFHSYWLQRNDEPKEQDAFLYIALGDSTAQGIGATSPEKGYVGLVADYLEKTKNRPVRVINLSVSGARVEDVLRDQIPKLSDYPRPDLVTIQIGANNIRTLNEATFRSDFTELVGKLPPETVISNVPSLKNGRFRSFSAQSDRASAIADDILQQSLLSTVDLHTVTKEEIGFFDTAVDFFHPDDTAYRKWADVFIQGIPD